MRVHKLLSLVSLCGVMLAMNSISLRAQYATWIGPASGAEWNTPADWDIGVPDVGTNATIGTGTNVSYSVPMAAASIGILTNNGVFNINASGFNATAIVMANPAGGDKIFINNGGVVTTTGNFTLSTNAAVTMTAGSSVTINGTLGISFGVSTHASGTAAFTNSGGMLIAKTTAINNNQGTENALLVISGGTNNLGNTVIGRSASSSFATPGTEGLVVYGGQVITTNLNVGNNGSGVSYLTAYIAGGTVTNFGNVYISQGTAGRGSRVLQTGGLFVVPDPNLVYASGYGTDAAPATAVINNFAVTGGTNIVGGLYLGSTNGTGVTTVNFTNGGVIYVGSQGIVSNGAATVSVSLNSGGLFGATAPWTGGAAMKLSGGMFTFQTADMNGNPNNITLSNSLTAAGGLIKTGGGTLGLQAANTYSGNTVVLTGTLALGSAATLTSPSIFVGSGATYDISQVIGYTLNGGQTLSGSGTVNGAVNVASAGTIFPGSNTVTGTLTISGALSETGGAINQFQLSSNPSGAGNDLLNASGGLTVSGANTISINGALQSGGVYPLITYGGTLNGGVANFTVSGANGVLSNSASAQTIYFIAQSSVRGPTNIVWIGNSTNNNWDDETSTNWLNTGTGTLDFFVPGDSALFSNAGAKNPQVNITGNITPSSITVNTTSNYTFTGSGSIGGIGSVIVSNGTLNVLTANSYNGPTILGGGVLATPNIANSLVNSGIGAASSSPANFVFNGGTFAYTGVSASTDRGITLTNGGGAIDVTNGTALTLNSTIVGNGPLTVEDSGTVILAAANSYTNTTTILGTALQLNNANGAGSGTINFSNAALVYSPSSGITVANNFNFADGTTNMIVVTSGSGGNPISSGPWTGNATIIISNTFNPYTVNGNLDGVTGTIMLETPGTAGFRFNSGGGNTSTGSTNATFDLASQNAVMISRNGGIINLGALEGGSATEVNGPSAAGTTSWSIGWNNKSTTFAGIITGGTATNELAALIKVGTGTLTLLGGVITNITTDGFDTFTNVLATNLMEYTGATTISNGTLALIVPDALTLSSSIIMASPSAVLDASQMGYVDDTGTNLFTNGVLEVVSGQSLTGIGTIRGTLLADANSTFNVGLPGGTGTLTVTGSVTLNGTIQLKLKHGGSPNSDELISQSSITNGGALVITNIGTALQPGDSFTLFHSANNSYVGTFSSVTLPTLTGSQFWNTNNLYINGTISVGATTPLSFSHITISGQDIVLNAVGGKPGDPVTILTSNNLNLPLAGWTILTTGNFDSNGDFTYTVTGALSSGQPQQFYLMESP
jgi:fibronectin-binding autotransporter adhesin